MRSFSTALLTRLTAVLALAVGFSSCDVADLGVDIEDAINMVISVPPVETVATVQILDANTGRALEQPSVIAFEGPAAIHVVDQFLFEPLATTRTSNGMVTFAFPDGLPYGGAPYTVKAKVSSEGYLDGIANIVIAEPGRYVFRATLVKAADPPAGIVVDTQPTGTTDATGTTQATVTVQTPTDATTGTAATVTVLGGTQATTSNGQPAQGNLNTTVVYNSVQTPEAQAVAVSQTSAVPVQQPDGSEITSSFITHSTFQVGLTDSGGQPVTQLSQPMEVAVPLPEINMLTGQPYAEGDMLTAYAKDEATGVWRLLPPAVVSGKRQAAAVRVARQSGTLAAVTSLGSLGDGLTHVTIGEAFPTAEVRFRIATSTAVEDGAILPPLSVRVGVDRGQGTGASLAKATHYEIELIAGEVFIAVWDGVVDVSIGLPMVEIGGRSLDFQIPVVAAVFAEDEVLGAVEKPIQLLLNASSTSIQVEVETDPTTNEALGRVDLELDCRAIDPTKGVIRPSTQFQYARQEEGTSGTGGSLGPEDFVSPGQTGNLDSGKAELMLELGTTYQVSVNYKGDTYRETFTTPTAADDDGFFDVEVNLTDEQIRSVCNEF
ncbi:MAG: hypothetical protein AAGJ10_21045 [Bacteroidota bacterium]